MLAVFERDRSEERRLKSPVSINGLKKFTYDNLEDVYI